MPRNDTETNDRKDVDKTLSFNNGHSGADTVPEHNPLEIKKSQATSQLSEFASTSTSSPESDSDDSTHREMPKQQTNRQAYGTWNRDFDFTLTCIGYVIGLTNFFRFPSTCYKFGTIPFLLAYLIVVVIVGIPTVFMEITIGQFGGVGSISAFRQLAPIITGVSYILAWSSFFNCWLTGSMLTWIRVYSGASLSCLKGWQGCNSDYFYNTPMCWTGRLESCCSHINFHDCPEVTRAYTKNMTEQNNGIVPESIFYNFQCIQTEEFCEQFGWRHTGRKECTDSAGKVHSVYERRQHASIEYLHGFVFGLRTRMTYLRRTAALDECQRYFRKKGEDPKLKCKRKLVYESPAVEYKEIRNKVSLDKALLQRWWNHPKAQQLHGDPESSSSLNGPVLAFTTVLFITIFLFDNLLRVSAVQYIFNGIPFCLFFYMLGTAFQFEYSDIGLYELFNVDAKLFKNLLEPELWVEALVHVLTTTGVGNGALISLASFNKYQHRYKFDVLLITLLNIVMSLCATALCFCTIANYIKTHNLASLTFDKFIPMDNGITTAQFGFTVYSIFVMLLEYQKKDIQILLFFIMFSSFPSDTAIRLAQVILDATVHILPRLRHHPTMALIAVVAFYYLTLLPVTQQTGAFVFTHFEKYSLHFAMPSVVLIEILSVSYVYKAQRLLDDAEQLGVISPGKLSKYLMISMKYLSPIVIGLTLIASIYVEIMRQLTHPLQSNTLAKIFGCWFSLVPIIMMIFNVAKQLSATPKANWADLFKPANLHEDPIKTKSKTKSLRKSDQFLMKSADRPSLNNGQPRNNKPQGNDGSTDEDPKSDPNHRNSKAGRVSFQSTRHRASKGSKLLEESDPALQQSRNTLVNTGSKNRTDSPDGSSIDSDEVSTWKRYIFWTELANHFEDWPDRLDETDFESEGSSDDSEEGFAQAKVFHVHYPVKQ